MEPDSNFILQGSHTGEVSDYKHAINNILFSKLSRKRLKTILVACVSGLTLAEADLFLSHDRDEVFVEQFVQYMTGLHSLLQTEIEQYQVFCCNRQVSST